MHTAAASPAASSTSCRGKWENGWSPETGAHNEPLSSCCFLVGFFFAACLFLIGAFNSNVTYTADMLDRNARATSWEMFPGNQDFLVILKKEREKEENKKKGEVKRKKERKKKNEEERGGEEE